jgi:hypothetical protein
MSVLRRSAYETWKCTVSFLYVANALRQPRLQGHVVGLRNSPVRRMRAEHTILKLRHVHLCFVRCLLRQMRRWKEPLLYGPA